MKSKRTSQASRHKEQPSLKEIAEEYDRNEIDLDQDADLVARLLAQREFSLYDVHCSGSYR